MRPRDVPRVLRRGRRVSGRGCRRSVWRGRRVLLRLRVLVRLGLPGRALLLGGGGDGRRALLVSVGLVRSALGGVGGVGGRRRARPRRKVLRGAVRRPDGEVSVIVRSRRRTQWTTVRRAHVAVAAPRGPLDVVRGFWPAEAVRAAWERVAAAGRLFATDNGGRELLSWKREDSPDLWDAAMGRLGGDLDSEAHATYAIRYLNGLELKPHSDAGNQRMVLVARAPLSGGVLQVEGRDVPLDVGDALFFTDSRRHAVTRVVGERWALTMGRLV